MKLERPDRDVLDIWRWKNSSYIGIRILEMQLPGIRQEISINILHAVEMDMEVVGVTTDDDEDRVRWRKMTHFDNP